MKHLKSLYEYFDSEELKTTKFDKKRFISGYQNVMNSVLVKLLANNEYLNEFDSDIIGNNIIFSYVDKNKTNIFKIHITKSEDKYILSTNDMKYIEMDESFLFKSMKTSIYNSFLKFKNNIVTK